MPQTPTAAIIGAGSSGIAAAKALHDRDIPFDLYEKSDRIGGNWVYGNKNGMSSAYKGLHINTSRDRMEYADFPMPRDFPDFPHHTQIAAYFDSYADRFGLREHILFENGVERAHRRDDGVWEVTSEHGGTREYDALLVANGHHWDPRWPEPAFPGSESTRVAQMHAHHYLEDEIFRGKKVVVLGMGNSAMDIAVESSYVAEETYLAARRGAWIIPKYVFGRPLDQFRNDPRVPWALRRPLFELMLRLSAGRPERYGLPTPDHRLGDAHPTISGRILDRITHGKVTPKPNIARFTENTVVFDDGSEVAADVVVYCTGYKVTFPFFDPEFISAPDNELPLFRRVFHPQMDNLFFLALLQPLGATMPLAEAQGKWIASYLRGEYALPDDRAMAKDIEAERAAVARRYVASKRHTMQVDFDDYMYRLANERRAGARRAERAGWALPVAHRAAGLPASAHAPDTAVAA